MISLFSQNLLPVFLAAGAGYLLARFSSLEPRSLSRVIFYIFSPSLVFNLITENQLSGSALLQMVAFAVSGLLLVSGLAALAARGLKLSRSLVVAVVLGALLPNAGNFGLSVNLFAFGEPGLAHASLFFVTSGIIANTAGVYIASLGRSSYLQALAGLVRIPTIYAVALALIFLQFGWRLPLPLERTTELLAGAAIPGMLVLLGLNLQRARWRGNGRALVTANVMRLLVSPAVGVALAGVFGLAGVARQAGVMQMAMPAAVMTTVLATEFDAEPAFVTSVVFTTTILSPLTLTPLLALLGA